MGVMPYQVRLSGIGSGTFGGTQSAAYALTAKPVITSASASAFFIFKYPQKDRLPL